jgi:hypothetical protein
MENQPWYLLPDLNLPIIFNDQVELKRLLPYRYKWLLLNSGGVYRNEPADQSPLYATSCTSFTARYLRGHFGVVPNPILLMVAGQTALLLSAVLSLGQCGDRYAGVFIRFTDISMALENVHANEIVMTRAWLISEPTFEGPTNHPSVIRGSVQATVDVIRHGGGQAKTIRVLTVNGELAFEARPKLKVFAPKAD